MGVGLTGPRHMGRVKGKTISMARAWPWDFLRPLSEFGGREVDLFALKGSLGEAGMVRLSVYTLFSKPVLTNENSETKE